jgi:hypothetical protein
VPGFPCARASAYGHCRSLILCTLSSPIKAPCRDWLLIALSAWTLATQLPHSAHHQALIGPHGTGNLLVSKHTRRADLPISMLPQPFLQHSIYYQQSDVQFEILRSRPCGARPFLSIELTSASFCSTGGLTAVSCPSSTAYDSGLRICCSILHARLNVGHSADSSATASCPSTSAAFHVTIISTSLKSHISLLAHFLSPTKEGVAAKDAVT